MRRRGYSLPLVLLVLTGLGLAMTSLTTVLADSAKTTGSLAGRRRTLYACDGVTRALAVTAGAYFKSAPNPNTSDLRQAICGTRTGPACPTAANWMPDYTLDSVEMSTGAVNVLREIPNGPFAGQTSRRTDLALSVAMTHRTGRACRVTQRMVNGQIGLFQFAVFSGVPIDLFNPAPMDITGRTHINGDFCAGGTGRGLRIERLTVSGSLNSGCFGGQRALVPSGNISTNGFFALDRTTNRYELMTSANDSSLPGWRAAALATWGGNVLDAQHEVPQLRLPVSTSTEAQPGNNQDKAARTNLQTLRVMVDPPRPSDTAETRAERLYEKADIRIINGVWYTRSGRVMWSDHTGLVTPPAEEASMRAANMPTQVPEFDRTRDPNTARRFSYYERDGGRVVNQPGSSVVSYGALFRAGGATPTWRPGVRSGSTVREALNDAERLQGARTGFVDRRVALDPGTASSSSPLTPTSAAVTPTPGEPAGRVLPLNFDIAAFTEAMTSSAPGELGSFFGGGAAFNGIVWIGNTWPGHDDGFTNNPAAATAAGQAVPSSSLSADGLNPSEPLPLCGSASSELAAGRPQVSCATPGLPRVNAVRVVNAATINPNVFPRGLTIATNGPLYTLGDVNTGSLNGTTPGTPRMDSPSGNWVPMMLAGDAVTILSRNWTDDGDADRLWGAPPAALSSTCTADAGSTTVVAAVVAGHVDTGTTWGGGINNFPRFLECWSGVTNRIVGSLVIGYRSVYQRQRYHLFSYRPPNRLWGFDPNLESPARQPPGTPMFFVQAIERWERD
ncbi:MAG: hypothetical protein FJ137_15790 [Deltaproteobacteria bacterium]|nr:hypothetical protein [Deltaproteobacteria bacterium]